MRGGRPSPDSGQETAPEEGRGDLPAAARRALVEAATRREAALRKEAETAPETGGRGGLEPVRYGDWEVKGKAVDF